MRKENTSKEENRKALKIFIPILIGAACLGGVIGVLSSFDTALAAGDKIGAILLAFFRCVSPYGVMISVVLSLILTRWFYSRARRFYREIHDGEEERLDEVEALLSKSMVVTNVGMIFCSMFFSITMLYAQIYMDTTPVLYLAATVFFILGIFFEIRSSRLQTDFVKEMNPKMKGSIYDINFHAKWEESCDELEKLMIYKAGYKAFLAGNTACSIGWILVTLLGLFFDYGPLPVIIVSAIWLTLTLTYYKVSFQLEHEKINES